MKKWFVLALAFGLVAACTTEEPVEVSNGHDPSVASDVRMPVLDDLSNYEGAPSNQELPAEGKADEQYPAEFDLLATQSPVRSQGSRGVCSMFSTIGLMEHLYIKEGTIAEPNFSEQFLQWSTKVEVGQFQNTDGSNAQVNLQAISQFGVVEESAWPYESRPWGTAEDEACTGDDRPVRCYTNGDPSQDTLAAPRYKLPAGRWVSTRTRDLKAYMYNNQKAVIVGGAFYYQSWNHGASQLPTNQEYWRNGYVLFPNDDDRADSEARRAGHSILLVGWNDNLIVERLDGEGNVMLGDDGEPLTEQGFFLFKNSWGTGSFGVDNIDGYGWISYRYVEQFKSARGAGLPQAHHFPQLPPECTAEELLCDNQCVANNEQNCGACGVVCGGSSVCEDNQCVAAGCDESNPDCSDVLCLGLPACEGEEELFAYDGDMVTIPDNDENGLETQIVVEGSGLIQQLVVEVFIEHTYNGDLRIELIHPSGQTVLLREDDGSPGNDVIEAFEVDDFFGMESEGTWRLKVTDTARLDEGELVAWYLRIKR